MRYFLRTIELTDTEERGVARRAWFGVKLVSSPPDCHIYKQSISVSLGKQTADHLLVCSTSPSITFNSFRIKYSSNGRI
jgi:hypothetical protein